MESFSSHRQQPGKKFVPPPTFCCISRSGSDKLQLIGFPDKFLPAFRIAVQTSWKKGIQSEVRCGPCVYLFKLSGNPWRRADRGSVDSCHLVIGIMRFMLSDGWTLELDFITHQQRKGMDSWFFRKDRQETHVVMCGISFKRADLMRVIEGEKRVVEVIQSAITNHWHKGLQEAGYKENYDAHEFKLNGLPWTTSSKEKVYAKTFIMHLIIALRKAGWTVYALVDLSSKSLLNQNLTEMDCWILKQSRLSQDDSIQ